MGGDGAEDITIAVILVSFNDGAKINADKTITVRRGMSLADAIRDHPALTSVNVLKNGITETGLKGIAAVFKGSKTISSVCGATGPELDLSDQGLGAEDAKIVGLELEYNRSLSSLDIKSNNIGGYYTAAYAGQAPRSQVFSSTPEGPRAIIEAIKCNAALACEDGFYHEWSLNSLWPQSETHCVNKANLTVRAAPSSEGEQVGQLSKGAKISVVEEEGEWFQIKHEAGTAWVRGTVRHHRYLVDLPREFKFASTDPNQEPQDDDPAVLLANGVCLHCGKEKKAHRSKGALTSIDLAQTRIPEPQVEEIRRLLRMKKLRALHSDDALTDLDISSSGLGVEEAKVVAAYIKSNLVLVSLNISNNGLEDAGMEYIADALGSNVRCIFRSFLYHYAVSVI
jgi:hypothetical protein